MVREDVSPAKQPLDTQTQTQTQTRKTHTRHAGRDWLYAYIDRDYISFHSCSCREAPTRTCLCRLSRMVSATKPRNEDMTMTDRTSSSWYLLGLLASDSVVSLLSSTRGPDAPGLIKRSPRLAHSCTAKRPICLLLDSPKHWFLPRTERREQK